VHRAITIAGGFRERADRNKIYLLRENDTTNVRVRVDAGSAVRPGDTVIVEESFF
jgi:polysaccharide export outer membrane protein